MTRAIPWITSNSSTFPDLTTALNEPNGLLAFGDDLSLNESFKHIKMVFSHGLVMESQ